MTNDRTGVSDDEVMTLLRTALGALPADVPASDDPPAPLFDGAKWVHDWLNMEAELAEITFDSTDDVELAGVRSTSALRELTFVSDATTIEIEIEPGPRTVDITGTIDPPVEGRVQLVVGGEVFADDIDDRGSFAVTGVVHGTVLAWVDTPSGTVRLGSFEI